MRTRWIGAVVIAALVVFAACDGGTEPPEIPDIDRVELSVIPMEGRSVQQTIIARQTGAGDFQSDGELLLAPGEYLVDLAVYEDNELKTDYLAEGPDTPLLLYALEGGLAPRLMLQRGFPDLLPLDRAAQTSLRTGKTSPLPPPGFFLTVADTSGTTGTVRLVLNQYERFADFQEGADPLRTDFDVQFTLRTVPSADE